MEAPTNKQSKNTTFQPQKKTVNVSRRNRKYKVARTTHVQVPTAIEARNKVGVSQAAFTTLLGVTANSQDCN